MKGYEILDEFGKTFAKFRRKEDRDFLYDILNSTSKGKEWYCAIATVF